jgi:sarcosine oxidase, subunit beta
MRCSISYLKRGGEGNVIGQADAVVIGGGIMGASSAYFLSRLGFGRIVLLEKKRLAAGATGYSAANVRQHYSNEIAIRLAVRGVEMFSNAEVELGGPAGFVQCGYMVIASERDEPALRTLVPLQQRLGVQTRLLPPEEIGELYPELELGGITLGCLESSSGYADPLLTVHSLVEAARRNGVRVYEGCQVLAIETDAEGISGVVTGDGDISTRVVVNAAGPWADRVGEMVGIDYSLSFSREHEAVFETPPKLGQLPVVADAAQRIFFRPHGTGQVLVGQSYPKEREPCDPESYDDRADPAVVDSMVERLARRVPALAGLTGDDYGGKLTSGYSGVYSITDDWYPIVGGEPGLDGYFAAIGGSGHGFKIGPPIGESLAATIAGETPPIDLSPLARSRFAEGTAFTTLWNGNRG